jgi:hypothetical protein
MEIQRNYPLDEAAPIIGITFGTLRQYVSLGIVESIQIGRKRVIPTRVLEKICAEGLDTKKNKRCPRSDLQLANSSARRSARLVLGLSRANGCSQIRTET